MCVSFLVMSDSLQPHRLVAHPAPLSMGFSRQEHRSALPFPSPKGTTERKKVKLLSRVWLFATPWTVAYQAPPSTEFSRQEYWSGLLFPSPIDYVSIQKYTVDLWTGMLELTGLLTYIFFSIVNTMKLRNPWLVESKDTEESQIWRNKKQADFLQADFLLQRGSVAPTSTLFKCMVY